MNVHGCPWCRCLSPDVPARLTIDTSAPFWPLVVEIDAIVWERRRGKVPR